MTAPSPNSPYSDPTSVHGMASAGFGTKYVEMADGSIISTKDFFGPFGPEIPSSSQSPTQNAEPSLNSSKLMAIAPGQPCPGSFISLPSSNIDLVDPYACTIQSPQSTNASKTYPESSTNYLPSPPKSEPDSDPLRRQWSSANQPKNLRRLTPPKPRSAGGGKRKSAVLDLDRATYSEQNRTIASNCQTKQRKCTHDLGETAREDEEQILKEFESGVTAL